MYRALKTRRKLIEPLSKQIEAQVVSNTQARRELSSCASVGSERDRIHHDDYVPHTRHVSPEVALLIEHSTELLVRATDNSNFVQVSRSLYIQEWQVGFRKGKKSVENFQGAERTHCCARRLGPSFNVVVISICKCSRIERNLSTKSTVRFRVSKPLTPL